MQPSYLELYNKNQLIMWLDISTYCNAACPQCHRTNPRTLEKVDWLPLVQWSYEQFVTGFPVATLQHIQKFDFCGTWGDPVMNKDLFQICQYIIDNSRCNIQINTNGSIRDDSWWWDLGVLCGDRLHVIVDIDGSSQEIHEKYRQKTDLKKIVSNMTSLAATRATVGLFTVVFKHNQEDLENIADLGKEIGAWHMIIVPSNRFNPPRLQFKYYNQDHQPDFLEKPTIQDDPDHPLRKDLLKGWGPGRGSHVLQLREH